MMGRVRVGRSSRGDLLSVRVLGLDVRMIRVTMLCTWQHVEGALVSRLAFLVEDCNVLAKRPRKSQRRSARRHSCSRMFYAIGFLIYAVPPQLTVVLVKHERSSR